MLYRFGKMIFFIYYHLLFRLRVTGSENIPAAGGVVICSNHLSNNDPMVLGAAVKRSIHFIAKQELFKNRFSALIMRGINAVPINRESVDMRSHKAAMSVLLSGNVLGIFAQGRRVKDLDAKDAKAGAALYALKSGVPLIPVKITSTYRPFSKILVNIGSPVNLDSFRGKKMRSDVLREATDVIVANMSKL